MKQCKIIFERYKKNLSNRPPDEIDFSLGFRAALKWLQRENTDGSCGVRKCVPMECIREELR